MASFSIAFCLHILLFLTYQNSILIWAEKLNLGQSECVAVNNAIPVYQLVEKCLPLFDYFDSNVFDKSWEVLILHNYAKRL